MCRGLICSQEAPHTLISIVCYVTKWPRRDIFLLKLIFLLKWVHYEPNNKKKLGSGNSDHWTPFFLKGEISNFEGVDLQYIKNQLSRTSMCDTSLERSQLGEQVLQINVYPKMNIYPSRGIFIPSEGYIYGLKQMLYTWFFYCSDWLLYTKGMIWVPATRRDWGPGFLIDGHPFFWGVKSAYFTGYS